MTTGQTTPLKLSQTERRKRVALGVQAGKSNRAIAKELDVDEGAVRRDRKFLSASVASVKTRSIRSNEPRPVSSADNPGGAENGDLQMQSIFEAVKHWIKEEGMALVEIKYVLHRAGERLCSGREAVRSLPAPTMKPSELIAVARPRNRDKDEIIPNRDFWADWLARWLALCLPRQEELQEELLQETSLWSRSPGK